MSAQADAGELAAATLQPSLLLRLRGAAGLERVAAMLRAIDTVCRSEGLDDDARHDLRIAVEEACVNVVRHAYAGRTAPGELALCLWRDRLDGRPALRLEISDQGPPFDPLAGAPPTLDAAAEDRPIGGLGIHLIRAFTDKQQYRRGRDGRNQLMLFKAFTPTKPKESQRGNA